MQIQLASPAVREDGDFTVYVNGSGIKKGSDPFAVIQLDENGSVDLTFYEPGDLDRLITAACQAKSLLVASRTPHPYRGADTVSSRCVDCGVMKGHHLEPEPVLEDEADAATVLAEAIRHGTPVIVTDDEPALEGTVTGECAAETEDGSRYCTAERGHAGPDHISSSVLGERRWPMTADEPVLEGTVTAPPQDAPYAEVIPAAEGSRM